MASITQGNPSYTMSLDNFDLGYFFRNIHLPRNGLIKPLWTNFGCKPDDYYEFEIITEKKNDVADQIYYDHNLICESYICHICNINVPNMYRKEHNQTTKHKVYLEIADKSLERSRKHINEEFDGNKSVVRYDCYFCPSCSAAVATELKGDHEKTPGHLISAKHDDILKELLKYYLNRDHVKIDFELDKAKVFDNLQKISKIDPIDTGKKKTKVKKKVDQTPNVVLNSSTVKTGANNDTGNNIDEVTTSKASNTKPQGETNKCVTSKKDEETSVSTNVNLPVGQTLTKSITADTEVNGTTAIKKNINEAANLDANYRKSEIDPIEMTTTRKKKKKKVKDDVTEVLDRYYGQISLGHKIKVINEDLLDIEPVNGKTVRVLAKNFHSYREVDGNTLCGICNLGINDFIESHMFSANHMILAMSPITDENCIRKCNDNYNHCILCNEIVEDVQNHIFNNLHHKFKMKNALINNDTLAESDITTILYPNNMSGKTYCEVCEVDINTVNFESHVNGKRHCENYDKKYPNLLKTGRNVENRETNSDMLTAANKSEVVTCKVCKVDVPKGSTTEHVKENGHILKYDAVASENKLQKRANGYYCDICKINVDTDDVIDHIEKRKHITGLDNPSALEYHDHFQSMIHDYSKIHCRVCEVGVVNELSAITRHMATDKHKDNLVRLVEENHMIKLDEWDEYYCLLCNELLQGQEITHIKSDEHVQAVIEFKSKHVPSPIHKVEIHPHMQTTANAKELKCKVCLIAVPFLPNSIKEHVKGKNHVKNYNKILDKFEKIDEIYYCETCKALLEETLVVDHCCEVNRKGSPETTSETREVKMEKPLPDGHVSCMICNVSIPNDLDLMRKHSISEVHLENFSKNMKYNQFVHNDDNYFFESSTVSELACSNTPPITVPQDIKKTKPSRNEVVTEGPQNAPAVQAPGSPKTPISGKHMEDMAKPGSLLCKICIVPVPSNTHCIELHVNGLKHKNKYNMFLKENRLDERANCFYCGFCETLFSKNLDVAHVFSDEHKRNIEATISAPAQKTSVRAEHYLMERMELTGNLQCKLCKTEVADTHHNVKLHLESPGHSAAHGAFVEKNYLGMIDNIYFCMSCNELLAKNTEYEHVESRQHKSNLPPNKYMCNICNVTVPNNSNNINEHLRGSSHRAKLLLNTGSSD